MIENTNLKDYLLENESKTRDLKIQLNDRTLELNEVTHHMLTKRQMYAISDLDKALMREQLG